jgi:hypothetical protein
MDILYGASNQMFYMNPVIAQEGCITIAAKIVFLFLSTAKRNICLAIGRLVDGILLPVFGSSERQCTTGSMFLL